ncbi:MAG: nucleotidyltransferase domain-containing protein [bacterium]|nr:nucleotidyltransferase domain-containing protein [bacterium]
MHEHSDVDLAVSGLPPGSLIRTLVRVDEIFGRYVDLVNLDHETPFTSYLKKKEGLAPALLHEFSMKPTEVAYVEAVDCSLFGCCTKARHGER